MVSLFPPKTPLRLQVNPIECGAACLGIILDYYGYQNQQHELNELLGISRNGSDALSLVKGIQHYGLKAEAKRRSALDLKDTSKPSILFFDSCHFVVLEGYKLSKYFINDPAQGRYCLNDTDFRRRYSGIEIEIEGNRVDKKLSFSGEHIAFGTMGFSFGALLVLLLMSISSAFSLPSSRAAISLSCALLFALFAMWYLLKHLFLGRINTQEAHFQTQFMDKCASLRPSFFETRPFSRYQELLSAIDTASEKIVGNYRSMLGGMLFALVGAQIFVCWIFSLLLIAYIFLCWALTAIQSFQVMPIPHVPNLKALIHHFLDMDAMGQKENVIQEYLAKDYTVIRFYYNEYKRKKYWLIIVFIVALLCFIIECLLGYYFTSNGILLVSLSLFLAVSYNLCLLCSTPRADNFRTSLLLEMRSEPKLGSTEPGISVSIDEGRFFYPGHERAIFEHLSISLKEATVYALVGGPRSGKSTLQKILGQKLTLNAGTMRLGNEKQQPLKCTLIDDDAELFSGSLLENVRVYETSFSEYDVTEALRLAVIDELFFNRPMGLLASIDQGGANLSGGQKKRLLLARALIHRPQLLLLDNFFDSLDDACSTQVLHNLKTLKQTVVFTSFRDHELALADQVIFIDKGQVKIAPHTVWMSDNQAYRALISAPLVRHDDANQD